MVTNSSNTNPISSNSLNTINQSKLSPNQEIFNVIKDIFEKENSYTKDLINLHLLDDRDIAILSRESDKLKTLSNILFSDEESQELKIKSRSTILELLSSMEDQLWLVSYFNQNEDLTHINDLKQNLLQLKNKLNTCRSSSEFISISDEILLYVKEAQKISKKFEGQFLKVSGIDIQNEQFGSKHANLIRLNSLAKAFDLKNIEVPLPRGISTEEVRVLLKKVNPEIFSKWELLSNKYKHADTKELSLMFSNPDNIKLLTEIQISIAEIFNGAQGQNSLSHFQPWIQQLSERGCFLMVRSSGAEDSETSANAGGNKSIAYVQPKLEDFSNAVGQVIISFFEQHSLQNRINAGTNPFNEDLAFSVTAQELIGESPDKITTDTSKIPRSIVFFSKEESYIGDEKFRISRGSVALGHGEGVVGNQGINCDTFLILQSQNNPKKLYLFYDNKFKPTRLAPVRDLNTNEITLKTIKNEPILSSQPALDKKTIESIFTWGILTESLFHGIPSDSELVVRDGTIFPVQARPTRRQVLLPTYIDINSAMTSEKNPIFESLKCELIVPGKLDAVIITNPDELLYADTLEAAEQSFDKNKHKIVIVNTEEPANSHPVVNFSFLGIPCLYSKNKENVQNLKNKIDEKKSLAICVQTASLHLWDNSVPFEEHKKTGYTTHPANIGISRRRLISTLPEAQFNNEVPPEIKNQLLKMHAFDERSIALNTLKNESNKFLTTQIENLQEKAQSLANKNIKVETTENILITAKSLRKRMSRTFKEAEGIFSQEEPERLKSLFHLKAIETILIAPTSDNNSLQQHSLINIQPAFKAAEMILDYQKDLSHEAYFSDLVVEGSKTPSGTKIEESWKEFLYELEELRNGLEENKDSKIFKQINLFKETFLLLKESKATPLFFIFFFSKIDKSLSTIEKLKLLSLNKKEINSLKSLNEHIFNTKNFAKDLSRFGEISQFPIAQQELFNESQFWRNNEFINDWKNQPQLVQTIYLQGMNSFVDLFDRSIKTMKMGTFENSIKIQNFHKMIAEFSYLMKDWTKLIDQDNFPQHIHWPVDKIIEKICSEIDNINIEEKDLSDLSPSRSFSVAGATIGSKTDFERHAPETLEDYFTLVHQNCLAIISHLASSLQEINNEILIPELFAGGIKLIESIRILNENDNSGPPQKIGTTLDENSISITFNIPLRNHSGTLEFSYNKNENKYVLSANLLGEARERWDLVLTVLNLLNQTDALPMTTNPRINKQEISFNWEIKNEKSLQLALQMYESFGKLSLLYENYDKYFQEDKVYLDVLKNGNDIKIRNYFLNKCSEATLEKKEPLIINSKIIYRDIIEKETSNEKIELLGSAYFRSLDNDKINNFIDEVSNIIVNPEYRILDPKLLELYQRALKEGKLGEFFLNILKDLLVHPFIDSSKIKTLLKIISDKHELDQEILSLIKSFYKNNNLILTTFIECGNPNLIIKILEDIKKEIRLSPSLVPYSEVLLLAYTRDPVLFKNIFQNELQSYNRILTKDLNVSGFQISLVKLMYCFYELNLVDVNNLTNLIEQSYFSQPIGIEQDKNLGGLFLIEKLQNSHPNDILSIVKKITTYFEQGGNSKLNEEYEEYDEYDENIVYRLITLFKKLYNLGIGIPEIRHCNEILKESHNNEIKRMNRQISDLFQRKQ